MEDRLTGNIVIVCYILATFFAVLTNNKNTAELSISCRVHKDSVTVKKFVNSITWISIIPSFLSTWIMMFMYMILLDNQSRFSECNFALYYEGIAYIILFHIVVPIITLYRLRKEYNVETHYQEQFEKAQEDAGTTCFRLIFAGAIGLSSCCWGTHGWLFF